MSANSSAFVRGAAILAVAGILARVIGAVFRIVLAAILGDEGIGLYQYAYPIYSTLLVISTAGVPVAVSKIMAEKIALHDYREAMRVFRIAFIILSLSGLLITLVLLFGADYIARVVVRDAKALYPIMAIAPAIFFVTIMASLRGFFQGQQNMAPTAISQLLEQLARVAFSIFMVIFLLPIGLEYAAAGATSGAAVGGLAGLLMLAFLYWRKKGSFQLLAEQQIEHSPESISRIIGRIFSLAIPVTIGGLVIPLITLIDLAVVPRQLQAAGFDIETARALYGQLTGMAGSVVYFPNVVALALSISLVPAISEAFALQDSALIKSRTAIAVKLTVLFSLPATLGLYLLAEPITMLLFNNEQAGYALAYLSWSVIPLCLYVTTTGLIQGLGRPIIPALNMLYGGLVKTVLAWYLTAMPELNIGGAAIASVVGIGVAAILNLIFVARSTGWRARAAEIIFLPMLAVAAMSLVVYATYAGFTHYAGPFLTAGRLNGLATLMAIFLGMLVYGLVLLITGGLSREELLMVPVIGVRLERLAGRLKLLRVSSRR
ncbi:MAG: polysaccharide biosynthesis protein [Dethiobacteria bacterium]|nr:polysaccharide biosynthesis protein [Dethiobacteria bacterium]